MIRAVLVIASDDELLLRRSVLGGENRTREVRREKDAEMVFMYTFLKRCRVANA